jgi:hypothetical protein
MVERRIQKARRLTQAAQARKCSRSPLHRAAATPLQQPRTLGAVSPEDVLGGVGPIRLLQQLILEGQVQTAAKHSEIIFRAIDHAEA